MKADAMTPIKKWEALFTEVILSRGADYCRKKAVKNIQLDDTGIEADVIGTETYHVCIRFEKENIKNVSCNCPYAADKTKNCKHMAAVLFTALAPEKAAKYKSPTRCSVKPLPPPKPNCAQVTIRIEDEDTIVQRYCAIPDVKTGDYVVFLLNTRETVGVVEAVCQMEHPVEAYGLGRKNHVLRITEKPEPVSPYTIRILPGPQMCRLTLSRPHEFSRVKMERSLVEKTTFMLEISSCWIRKSLRKRSFFLLMTW